MNEWMRIMSVNVHSSSIFLGDVEVIPFSFC